MAMDSPETVSSKLQPKYVTFEYCFILMSLYWMFSGFDLLILCLLPNKIDFVLSSPKWILNLLSTNQSQSILKFLLSDDTISVILYVEILSKCHQHIAIVHSQQLVAYHLYITEKGVLLKWILEELCIGGFQVLRKYSTLPITRTSDNSNFQ